MKRLSWILIALIAFVALLVLVITSGRRADAFVVGQPLPRGKIHPQVCATWDRAYLLAPDGSLWAWGGTRFGNADVQLPGASEIPRPVGTNHDWVKFSAGLSHVLAITADGSLWGWGDNSSGGLGVVSPASSTVPLRIGSENDWQEVSVASHSLAIKTNGSLWAWGLNREGQVGDSAQTNWFEPREILPGSRWRAISTGHFNSYALRTDGTLWRWGLDPLAPGTKHDFTPRQLGDDTNWVAISAGEFHLLALKRDGSVWLHGQNAHLVAPRDALSSVSGLVQFGRDQDWREIYSGANCVTLRKADGSWWVCGLLARGKARVDTPRRIEWAMDPWAFSGGGSTGILLAKDGNLWSWGDRLGSKAPRNLLKDGLQWFERLLSGRRGFRANPDPIVDTAPHKVWSLPAQTTQSPDANPH